MEFKRGNFRVKGDTVDIFIAYADFAYRVFFFGDEIERLNRVCAYPCFDQTQDDALHSAYSDRGRQCIKYVRVSEEWVRDQLDYVYSRHVSHAHPF